MWCIKDFWICQYQLRSVTNIKISCICIVIFWSNSILLSLTVL
nr:MAG TPA: hypothetical protein [Inoviridae sp.]